MYVRAHHNYNKLFLAALLGLVCIVGDNFVLAASQGGVSKWFQSVCDNVTHGIVAAVATLILVQEFSNRLQLFEQRLLIAGGFVMASLMDVDHFIEARSIHLEVRDIMGTDMYINGIILE